MIDGFGGDVTYLAGEKNRGTAFARNRAAEAATGDYVVFIDDDCVPPPGWLDWLEARLLAHPDLDVVAGTTVPLWDGRPRLFDRVQDHHRLLPHPISLGDETIYVTASFCVRRELLQSLGGFAENPHFTSAGEDTEFSVRLQRAGARIRVDPAWTVAHELGTLPQYMRRYRRYGFINTMATEMTTAPAMLMAHRSVRRRSLFRRAIRAWRKEARLARSFPGRAWERLGAAGAATLVRIAYDSGCAEAAAQLRARSSPP